MKIVDFKLYTLSTGWRNLTYLILQTDAGIQGFGEAHIVGRTHTVCEFLRDVRRHIIGHDVFDVEALYEKFTLLDFAAPGQITMTGLALVEMACWDCIGKKLNEPVYKLIGGAARTKIPAYANGWYKVQRTPGAFAEAANQVVRKGYRAMKMDPFGNANMELSREQRRDAMALVEAVRGEIGPCCDLFIEMHGRFTPYEAVAICRDLEPFQPGFIEEPCRPQDPEALRYVMAHTCIPIAAGERLYNAAAYRSTFQQRLVHIVQPDVSQCGGLLEVKKICSTAETLSMTAAPHNVGGAIATAANIHLMATLRNGKILEHFNDFTDCEVKRVAKNYPEVADGYFSLPEGPGWGVELDLAYLAANAVRPEGDAIEDPGLNMYCNADWNRRTKAD